MLAAQGMTSGFGFLWKSTGWEMNFTLLPAAPTDPHWWFLLLGLLNALFIGGLGLIGASVIGMVVGLARSGRNPAARCSVRAGSYLPGLTIAAGPAALEVLVLAIGAGLSLWLARRQGRLPAAPLLLAGIAALGLLWLGHAPGTPWISWPALQGLKIDGGLRLQPEFCCLALAITLYGGAYVGEIVRGGFKAVGRGQIEAAAALGLSPWQVFARVRLPLAFRAMLPILINQYVWLIKATTLGIAVGFSDFFMVIASSITHSGQTLELIGILMGGFLAINFTLSAVLNRVNRAIALKGHNMGGAA